VAPDLSDRYRMHALLVPQSIEPTVQYAHIAMDRGRDSLTMDHDVGVEQGFHEAVEIMVVGKYGKVVLTI
jgi:hypothetical protein